MSTHSSYPQTEQAKIARILQEADSHPVEAQRLLAAATIKDHQLLLALAAPFMKGIVAYAIDHVRGKQPTPKPKVKESGDVVRRAAGATPAAAIRPTAGRLIREEQLANSDKQAHAANLKTLAAAFQKKK